MSIIHTEGIEHLGDDIFAKLENIYEKRMENRDEEINKLINKLFDTKNEGK